MDPFEPHFVFKYVNARLMVIFCPSGSQCLAKKKGMKSSEAVVAAVGSLKVNADDVKRTQLKNQTGYRKRGV